MVFLITYVKNLGEMPNKCTSSFLISNNIKIASTEKSNIQFVLLAMQSLISAWQLSHLKKHITLVSQKENFQDLDTLWKDP